jgi:hypothetical protein
MQNIRYKMPFLHLAFLRLAQHLLFGFDYTQAFRDFYMLVLKTYGKQIDKALIAITAHTT